MLVVGTPRRRGRGAALLIAAACAASAWGCTSGRVFQQGNQAAMRGDWDVAVTCYEKAAKASPGRADYRMALDRARMTAAQGHFERARDFEKRDQLDLALAEYRRVVEFHPASQEARARVQALEQIIRDRIEASRPRPAAELMRQQARQAMDAPALNPASREPVEIRMLNRQIQEVLDFLGSSTGINIAYDKDFPKNTVVSVNVSGITLEDALNQILTVNQAYYKVLNPRSIIIIADSQAKRTAYDEQAVQTFFLSSAEATDMEQLLTKVVAQQQGLRPTFAANKSGNSITVRGTVPMLKMIERIIAMNDKPRAELSIDVEILEVDRSNARKHGLDLSSWSIGLAFSPETRPGTDAAPFNLNTVSAGVSTLDFYASVPSATVTFLESDSSTKVIAKPNLRGSEGEKLSLKLGEEVPVPSTTFYNSFGSQTGVATSPMTSFTYKNIGVNLDIEPRVTYDGEITMKLTLEVSSQSSDRTVAGQTLPAFSTRKVETRLRLRDGESNLLAGLLREDERKSLKGFPGAVKVPILKQLFSSNDNQIAQTDIVMLLTPHIVRTHEMTQKDFTPIYIGTQQNLGLSGPPPLIQPAGEAPASASGVAGVAGQGPGGAAASPRLPPTVPVPGMLPVTPPATMPAPAAAAAPPSLAPPAGVELPAAPPPVAEEPAAQPAAAVQPSPATPPPVAADNLRIVLTPPSTPVTVAGQAVTVPISVFGGSRVSTVTLSLRFDPKVLRVRLVQQGSFLSTATGSVTLAQQVDAAAGRLDVTLTRTSDTTGVSGDGVLAAVVFDAIGAGVSSLGLGGVVTSPGGLPIPAQFGQASITVR